MPGIFISYRRDDTAGHALRVYRCLADRLPSISTFLDVASIRRGQPWQASIDTAVRAADVVVVVIGRNWADARLDDPSDVLRKELLAAIEAKLEILPVLVDGAELPAADDLPADLRDLLTRQALWLDYRDESTYEYGLDRLATEIGHVLNVQSTVVVRRLSRLTQALFAIDLYIDGVKVASVDNGETKSVVVAHGKHTILVRRDLALMKFESRSLSFDIERGETRPFTFYVDGWRLGKAEYVLFEGTVVNP